LIPWDGSREASGAVHDALPLLKQADKARILIVEPEKLETTFGDIPGARLMRLRQASVIQDKRILKT